MNICAKKVASQESRSYLLGSSKIINLKTKRKQKIKAHQKAVSLNEKYLINKWKLKRKTGTKY